MLDNDFLHPLSNITHVQSSLVVICSDGRNPPRVPPFAVGSLPQIPFVAKGASFRLLPQGHHGFSTSPDGAAPACHGHARDLVCARRTPAAGRTMGQLFQDELYNDFGIWPLGYIPAGGADYGEVQAVADTIGKGDDAAYFNSWTGAAERLFAEAETALAKGHRGSARDLYLRASVFYGASYHPLYGAPVDSRLLSAFRKQRDAFDRGLSLTAGVPQPFAIPFQQTALPAYFIPAEGHVNDVRPLIIFTNGYDGTITDMYFASAVAASRRGYHCLLFDGPGQGAMLYEQNVPLRPDWETVITAVVDHALTLPLVDPARIVLNGWSLGGYLAPRGASGEHRLAALIADPGTWSIADGFRKVFVQKFGLSADAAKDLGKLDPALIAKADAFIRSSRSLNWKVVQRGFWVHGVDNLRDYLASAELFTMKGRAELIRCPTLITQAEGDGLSADAGSFFDALRCPKTLMQFTAAEGASGHCEMMNRSLLNRRALDWLDERLAT
ncbi:alpha/beta hydrolase family protein [Aestuariivirga sp.]|uniref:alpha/beta hydrolase family protein n=1 Tax=Aestuariivirga sp. TaxID=2650926 RepID=UPI0039E4B206